MLKLCCRIIPTPRPQLAPTRETLALRPKPKPQPRPQLAPTRETLKLRPKPLSLQERLRITKLPSLQTGRVIKFSTIPTLSIRRVKTGTVRAIDFVSGGALTERRLKKRSTEINKQIEKFNKKFGGRELSENELIKANAEAKNIETEQEKLDEAKDKLAKSLKSKLRGFVDLTKKRLTKEEEEELIKKQKARVPKLEKELKKINSKLEKAKKKKGLLSKINTERLKSLKKITESEIKANKGSTLIKPQVLAGTFPIIPAVSIPSGITTIKFIGTQKKGKAGKIITDIAFKTSKGEVGIAKGISVSKGKETASVVLGRSGKVAFKFPSAKIKATKVKSFIGREVSVTKPIKAALRTKIDLLKKSKKIGQITKIKKNIEALKQTGVGQVASVRGKKFLKPVIKFPSGKIKVTKAKRILMDDFASMSAIFTKKELSLIIGKTITRPGAKSRFIGLIKGTGSVEKLSISDKQQFAKALKKVVSTTAAALSKSEKVSGLTKAGSLATATKLAVDKAKTKPPIKLRTKIKPTPKAKPKPILKPSARVKKTITIRKPKAKKISRPSARAKPKVKAITKPKVKVKRKISQTPTQAQRQKIKQLQKQKQKILQKAKQKLNQKQLQKQKQRLQQVQKQLNKLVPRGRIVTAPTIPRVPRIPIIPIPRRKKRRRIITKKPVKKKIAYNVFARPLKKKKGRGRPKAVKVNRVPLTKARAKDLRNFVTDTSLSRTARAKKTRGKPKKPKLKFPKNYSKKTTKKFRRHRIVKGKRKPIPKNTVIEKKRNLLDTIQEKNQITLRKRIKQLQKKKTPKKKRKQTRTKTKKR